MGHWDPLRPDFFGTNQLLGAGRALMGRLAYSPCDLEALRCLEEKIFLLTNVPESLKQLAP